MISRIDLGQLYLTPRSPFARRVRTTLMRYEIPFGETEATPFEPSADFLKQNPLGLVPAVTLKNGQVWIDSAAILENLWDLGIPIWPRDVQERIAVRQASVLAEGLMSLGVSYYLENNMRKVADPSWVEDYDATALRTLSRIQELSPSKFPWWVSGDLSQAGWDLGVALEYTTLRMPHLKWAEKFPDLKAILDRCLTSKAFLHTRPPELKMG
ncbi:MAG: glutathione S-transferase family protein [Bdellovibrionales bacterium]|nr:glutathione S-transferase family protein [Bdellovibrionales bacterium]